MHVAKTKHGIDFISTKDISREQWLHNRQNGIGGSDIGTLFGVNPYFSALELFYQKIGLNFSAQEAYNKATYWGTVDEDGIRDVAQYYDLETDEYLDGAGKALQGDFSGRLRRISEFPYMIINQKYPKFIANVDGLSNFHNRWFTADSIVECKTISRQSAEMWQSIPIYHYFQIHFYYIVLEPMLRTKDLLIFYKQDGREFKGYKFEVSETICQQIIEKATDFMERVDKGKKIVAEHFDNEPKMYDLLMDLHPETEDSKAYSAFLSELYKKKESMVEVKGTEEELKWVTEYNKNHNLIKELEKQKQLASNHIKTFMYKNSAEKVVFPDIKGQITYNKRLYINVKQ